MRHAHAIHAPTLFLSHPRYAFSDANSQLMSSVLQALISGISDGEEKTPLAFVRSMATSTLSALWLLPRLGDPSPYTLHPNPT
jgi:hypothetical protein